VVGEKNLLPQVNGYKKCQEGGGGDSFKAEGERPGKNHGRLYQLRGVTINWGERIAKKTQRVEVGGKIVPTTHYKVWRLWGAKRRKTLK